MDRTSAAQPVLVGVARGEQRAADEAAAVGADEEREPAAAGPELMLREHELGDAVERALAVA
jgi:hypothetical protein